MKIPLLLRPFTNSTQFQSLVAINKFSFHIFSMNILCKHPYKLPKRWSNPFYYILVEFSCHKGSKPKLMFVIVSDAIVFLTSTVTIDFEISCEVDTNSGTTLWQDELQPLINNNCLSDKVFHLTYHPNNYSVTASYHADIWHSSLIDVRRICII